MLSSVLKSPRAVQVNIEIMRAFVRLREMLQTNKDLARKLTALRVKNAPSLRGAIPFWSATKQSPATAITPIGPQPARMSPNLRRCTKAQPA